MGADGWCDRPGATESAGSGEICEWKTPYRVERYSILLLPERERISFGGWTGTIRVCPSQSERYVAESETSGVYEGSERRPVSAGGEEKQD